MVSQGLQYFGLQKKTDTLWNLGIRREYVSGNERGSPVGILRGLLRKTSTFRATNPLPLILNTPPTLMLNTPNILQYTIMGSI